jgi:hypothetical protein
MPRVTADEQHVPTIGDRVEMRRNGVIRGGVVHYADSIQALVKWDDGASSSLRIGRDPFRIVHGSVAPRQSAA